MTTPHFFNLTFSIFSWVAVAVVTVVVFAPVALTGLFTFFFDRNRSHVYPLISFWARAVLLVCPVMRIKIRGEQQLDPTKPYVLVCNHQSLVDILVVLHLRSPFKFIAKKELFWIPFLGWALWIAGFIRLDRSSKTSGKEALEKSSQFISRGMSVLFFPEGTRSRDGQVHDFKVGAFKLAAGLQVPIVPIVIDGTLDIVQKGSKRINRNARVVLDIGAPRRPSGNSKDAISRLMVETRAEMVERLEQVRASIK
jgi:1-acyl-sn-glycerol-3-phosphate acyltransferase